MHEMRSSGSPDLVTPAYKPWTTRAIPASTQQGVSIDLAIAAAYFVLVAAWSLIIRFNGAPDELAHLFLVEYLVRFGEIPRPQIDPVVPFIGTLTNVELQKTIDWYYGLPFAADLGAAALAKLFSPLLPTGDGYLAARLFDWLLGGIFMFALIRSLLWSGVEALWARLIAVLVATIPQVTFVFAYFNHDAFGVAAVALGLHAFLRTVKRPVPSPTDAIYLGAACGFIIVAKPYHYPALVFFGLMLLLVRWLYPTFPLRAVTVRAAATAILVSGPILAWTYLLFGEITGSTMLENFLAAHPGYSSAAKHICYVFCEPDLVRWKLVWEFVAFNFLSFFGLLGWMNIYLPTAAYSFWFMPLSIFFGLLSVIFVVRRIGTFRSTDNPAPLFDANFVTLTILMLLGTLGMSLSASQMLAPQSQGRYLFVVLPFVAYCIALFAIDAQSILTSRSKEVGARSRALSKEHGRSIVVSVIATLSSFMVLLNTYTALFVLMPVYRIRTDPFSDVSLDFNTLAKALSMSPTGLTLGIPQRPHGVQGSVDATLIRNGGSVAIDGWAFDSANDRPAMAVVVVYKGVARQVVEVDSMRLRAVKTTGRQKALYSGFTAVLYGGDLDPCAIQVFAVTSSLEASELPHGRNACPK